MQQDTAEPITAEPITAEPILLIDLSSTANYSTAHIKHAIHIPPGSLIGGVKPAVGKLPTEAALNTLFGAIGYNPKQHIIAYDDEGGGWAGRFIWTLDVIGHKNMSYLNGGIHAWLAADLATTTEVPVIKKTAVKVQIHAEFIASQKHIINTLGDPETLIWDARAPEEYSGQKQVSARGGHIPGAINYEWTKAMDQTRQRRIRTDLKESLTAHGITGDKKIITHCQSHHRSGFTYLLGKSLGYQITAYDGSWSEWGNDANTPIEVG
ncbi:MAG: sulfurtransferase [Pseudomonadales bacterium]|nr:sulfurtransferase [Pseudomonadales bacterium]